MRLLQAARLSRLNDVSTGIEKQDEAVIQYATGCGDEIIGRAEDTDVSGNTRPFDRPQLGPWLTSRADEFDGIIASGFDRLGRNVQHLAELLQWAVENKKAIITVDKKINWTDENGVGKLIWGIFSWLAEEELKAITKRSVDTQTWLKANEYLVGRPPFGFRVVLKGDKHKTLEPVPELKPVIKELVARALKGDTLTSMCEWLDAEGIKPAAGSGIWSPVSVSQILRNEALIGRRKVGSDPDGRALPDLRFEPIISTNLFEELKAKLDSNPRRRGAVSNDPALMSGVLDCTKCKGVMHRRQTKTTRKDGSKYVYEGYRCDGTARAPSTCKNMIPMAGTDAQMDAYFMTDEPSDKQLIDSITIAGHGYEDEIYQLSRDIDGLDKDAPSYRARWAALMDELDRLKALPSVPTRKEDRPTGELVRDYWARLTTAERRVFMMDRGIRVEADRETFRVIIPDPSAIWWDTKPSDELEGDDENDRLDSLLHETPERPLRRKPPKRA